MNAEKIFTLKEVEKLVKNAYQVGYCDGIDSIECGETNYINEDDFWNSHVKDWTSEEITYII